MGLQHSLVGWLASQIGPLIGILNKGDFQYEAAMGYTCKSGYVSSENQENGGYAMASGYPNLFKN